ncbi:hypothetical protein QVD17_15692 [Tagetes erecta]|uniref:Uncharacterized protein n=1 Tax=Tagetes erecta TaxID=13708 RepID=A0AAD8KPM6_TARER|nr:hypothetical protein QVD17_15692 [Tagetes erecta]
MIEFTTVFYRVLRILSFGQDERRDSPFHTHIAYTCFLFHFHPHPHPHLNHQTTTTTTTPTTTITTTTRISIFTFLLLTPIFIILHSFFHKTILGSFYFTTLSFHFNRKDRPVIPNWV